MPKYSHMVKKGTLRRAWTSGGWVPILLTNDLNAKPCKKLVVYEIHIPLFLSDCQRSQRPMSYNLTFHVVFFYTLHIDDIDAGSVICKISFGGFRVFNHCY